MTARTALIICREIREDSHRERRLGMGTHFAYLKLKNFIALSMNDGDMTFPSVCLSVPPTRCSIVSKRQRWAVIELHVIQLRNSITNYKCNL